jgi:hypothetical protein
MYPRLTGRTVEEKLRFNIDYDPDTKCWLWRAGKTGNGYGSIALHGKSVPVHRVAYELWIGPLRAADTVDHTDICRNCLCINPAHLESITGAENTRRMQLAIRESKRIADLGHREQCGDLRGGQGRVVCEMETSWHRTHRKAGSHVHHGRGPSGRWFSWED